MYQFTHNTTNAAQLLQALDEKDQNPDLCLFPGCHEKKAAPSKSTGRVPLYCINPQHNPQTNKRARESLRDKAQQQTAPQSIIPPEAETIIQLFLTRTGLIREDIERFATMIQKLDDPEYSLQQINAAKTRANTEIALADQKVSDKDQELLAAIQARNAANEASNAAIRERDLARTAEQTSNKKVEEMEQAVINALQEVGEAQQERDEKIKEAKKAFDDEAQQIADDAQAMIKQFKNKAENDIALAKTEAEEKISIAKTEEQNAKNAARDALADAKIQTNHAALQVKTANDALEKEREEVGRLRQTITDMTNNEKDRAEADGKEIGTLRQTITDITKNENKRANDDSQEITRLRGEVTEERSRLKEIQTTLQQLQDNNASLLSQLSVLMNQNNELRGQIMTEKMQKEKP